MSPPTAMAREAREAPDAVRRQLDTNRDAVAALVRRLKADPPRLVATLARGSSDHAATYGRYLFETVTGVPTCSVSPSIASVYGRRLDLAGSLFLAISQSGKSPDLLAGARAARDAGALVVAITNTPDSPLAALGTVCLPLCAGAETSVAATKTFIATMSCLAHIVAVHGGDAVLREGLDRLPDALDRTAALDWGAARPVLVRARSLYTVGRGVGFGIAQEAALKFKETCRLHGEAFSAAELMHGPLALIEPGFPVLMFRQEDAAGGAMAGAAGALREKGAALYVVRSGPPAGEGHLPVPDVPHPALGPVAMIQGFYLLVERVARDRGLDPDNPPHLRKVTETA